MYRWLAPLTLVVSLSPSVVAQGLPNRVAAGELRPNSAVVWARPNVPGFVLFEVSRNASFHPPVRRALSFTLNAERPVKRTIRGLRPGTTYYYRATDLTGAQDTGRFRTAHGPSTLAGLHFGVSGDARGDQAPFPAVVDAAAADLDFFVMLGDTVYADIESPALPGVQQAVTLHEFRAKHNENITERDGLNSLADLRASTALFAAIDDHEVTNDFSGGASPSSDPRFDDTGDFINETELYGNGLQAFVEYNPTRSTFYGYTGDPRTSFKRKLYRARAFGKDAAIFLLDARSFRDQGLPAPNPFDPASVFAFLTASFDPSRTMLGREQLDDLKADLVEAQERGVVWKLVMVPEPIQNLGVLAASDRFEGYAAERTELLGHIHDEGIENVVFVAADIHGTVTNDLFYQAGPGAPQIPVNAFEITTGPVAFDAPFGPTVVQIAFDLGLIGDAEFAFYQSLPLVGQDEFVRTLVDSQITPLGYDSLGIAPDSLVDATLLAGSYVATHTYGWTEFEIAPDTSVLTITTWGLDPADLAGPTIVRGRFQVTPQ